MTEKQKLLMLIDCIEKFNEAKSKYEKHPGGGASQKIKNQLAREYKIKLVEMNNAVFNIKQQLK